MTALMTMGGCPQLNPTPDPQPPAGGSGGPLHKIGSSSELLKFIQDQATARTSTSRGGVNLFDFAGMPEAAPASDTTTGAAEGGVSNSAGDAAGGDATGDRSFSSTNLQEEGVDESDVMKSDGTYLYVARGKTVRFVKAVPADQLAEVGQVILDDPVSEMYLNGNNLIVLSTQYSYGNYDGNDGAEILIWPPFYRDSAVIVTQIDITDRSAPGILATTKLDGSLVSSRLTNGRLVMVMTIYPSLPADPTPLAISNIALDDVMPHVDVNGALDRLVEDGNWYRPDKPDGFVMSAVVTLDAADVKNKLASVGVIGDVGTIYSSTEAVYLTDDGYDAANAYRQSTTIHKFAYDDAGAAQYAASGTVNGRLINQFALSEHNGYLRVASHLDPVFMFRDGDVVTSGSAGSGVAGAQVADDAPASSEDETSPPPADIVEEPEVVAPNVASNSVYILGQQGGDLSLVGQITGIAPGENLYAARFLGDRGFLVTFVQVDPLFALDLSDPTAPKIAGELKIPGYSDYLHPLDETHLIGVGRSTAISPWGGIIRNALQLSLFDVSDLANPTVVQQLSIGGYGSASDVSNTHKAFTILENEGQTLMALPGDIYAEGGQPWDWSYRPAFSGVLCYRVDPIEGFVELGRVAAVQEDYGNGWTWAQWRRPAIIDNLVYAITDRGVAASMLADFGLTYSLTFAPTAEELAPQDSSGFETPLR